MTFKQIEQKYHVGKRTIYRTVQGAIVKTDQQIAFTRNLLEHENRWDLLLSYEQMISQGEANKIPAVAGEVTT